jgi:thiol-disulfide isomerase/thioredoxin
MDALKRFTAVLVVALCACTTSVAPMPAPGQPFPSLTLTALDGAKAPIESFRGRLVVLNIWATWCAPCRTELPGLDRLSRMLDPSRFVVVGLAIDSDAISIGEFLLQNHIRFANYRDADHARDTLAIRAYPVTFVIAPDGRLLLRMTGARVWDGAEAVAALEKAYREATNT